MAKELQKAFGITLEDVEVMIEQRLVGRWS